MRASLFLSVAGFIAALLTTPAAAADMPEIPNSYRVITVEQVKNYWIAKLPRALQPSRLSRNYAQENSLYHQRVGERHRLIREIRAGRHDYQAKVVMLRHNIVAWRLRGDNDKVLELGEELEALEKAEAAKRQEQRARRVGGDAEAERLERLIAATERLAAAIEENGGAIPDEAEEMVQEIVPFERNRDRGRHDRRAIIAHLHAEIERCRQPIIVHDSHSHGRGHSHTSSHRGSSHRHDQQSHTTPSRPSRSQQQSKPSGRSQFVPVPAARPAPAPAPVQVKQPQTPAFRAPKQPQVIQPKVRQAR